MEGAGRPRCIILRDAAALLEAAIVKLDESGCDVAAAHATHALDLVRETLSPSGEAQRRSYP